MKILTAICILFFIVTGFAQGEVTSAQGEVTSAQVLNLLLSATPQSMGFATQGYISDDPFLPAYNPAHLGMHSSGAYLTYGKSIADQFNRWSSPNFSLQAKAVNAGISLKDYFPELPDISAGIGYAEMFADINFSYSRDVWKQYSFGLSLNYGIRVSAGFSLKHVETQLFGAPDYIQASARLYDIGILTQIPVADLLAKSGLLKTAITPELKPRFDINIGSTISNLGQNSIYYINPSQIEPLPRQGKIGVGIALGLDVKCDNIRYSPVYFSYTVESFSMLVRTNGPNNFEYLNGLGRIKIFDELIAGHINPLNQKIKAMEITLLETFSIRYGHLEESEIIGNQNFYSYGYSVNSEGLAKTLHLIFPGFPHYALPAGIGDHLSVRLTQSLIQDKRGRWRDWIINSGTISDFSFSWKF